ncbi:MAG: PspC domain-containing protein [Ignavibacteria bacterium]|nr:PspC domain-containing protein [Ignavibacteria bacterium]
MKRLYRSLTDRKLGGVCAGVGEYLDVDPTVVRLLVVIVAIATALVPVFLGYVIAWIIIPEAPRVSST